MNFKSDNVAPVHPKIMQAIVDANIDTSSSYGHDIYSEKLKEVLTEVFEHEITFYMVSTGTAANSLALSAICPPYGEIYCSHDAHILHDECNSPGLFCHGARLSPSTSSPSKINIESIKTTIEWDQNNKPHTCKPGCISITQVTELGQVYTLEEIQNITKFAHENNMKVHMDGARFANALVSLNCTPAEMTWKSGIDVLTFGATKDGGLMGELIIFFNNSLIENFDYIHKRGGQLMSKTRFFAAQMIEFFKDNLWINLAKHSNNLAQELYKNLKLSNKFEILYPVPANAIFIKAKRDDILKLWNQGAAFYDWNLKENSYRFVTSWYTKIEDINNFINLINKL